MIFLGTVLQAWLIPISVFSAILETYVLIDTETCFEKNSILWMFNKKVEFHCCWWRALGLMQSSGCRSWPWEWAHRRARSHEEWMWQNFRLSALSFPANTFSAATGGLFIDFMLQGQISIFPPEWILWERLSPPVPLLGRCSARGSCPFSQIFKTSAFKDIMYKNSIAQILQIWALSRVVL